MKSKDLKSDIRILLEALKEVGINTDYINRLVSEYEAALLEDYEDYMTDRISREPGKIFDRKAVIQEFVKQL